MSTAKIDRTRTESNRITVLFPEPRSMRGPILPVFIPFHGCPRRCVFCAQDRQTGTGAPTLDSILKRLRSELDRTGAPLAVGIFGGTFTALPERWRTAFLTCIEPYKIKGIVTHVRCSTRPDAVSVRELERMRKMGLDMVELGAQSFDDDCLSRSNRGHGRSEILTACAMVRQVGLELGLQLMPGIPGQAPDGFHRDVHEAIALGPDIVRLYPCLVLKNTVLAAWWREGRYRPWSLETTVETLARTLPRFWSSNIRVIRIGIPPEPTALTDILDGPWHPALGNLVRSRALSVWLRAQWTRIGPWSRALVPVRLSGDLWGHKGNLKPELAAIGLSPKTVSFHAEPDFIFDRDRI